MMTPTTASTFCDAIRAVPPWAGAITLDEYRAFLALVDAELTRRDLLPYELGDGVVRVLTPAHRGERLGLETLLAQCRVAARGEWAGVVGAHFAQIDRSTVDIASLLAIAGDFAAVRARLRVRLHPAASGALPGGDGVVHRLLVPGIRAALAYDLGGSVVSVPPDHARRWGQDFDALLAVALANVRDAVSVARRALDFAPGLSAVTLWGASNSASSHALLLDRHIAPPTPYGALVVVPARHAVVFHPIRDATVLAAAQYLAELARVMHANEPGPISAELYWWRDGQLAHLPFARRAGGAELAPPADFVARVLVPLAAQA